jgi:hypothetical protein
LQTIQSSDIKSMAKQIHTLDARILSISGLISKQGIKDRKEAFILTSDGMVYLLTLWPPFTSVPLVVNDIVAMRSIATRQYKGVALSTRGYSDVTKVGHSGLYKLAKEISGGIDLNEISEIEGRISDSTPVVFGWTSAVMDSYNRDITYDACSHCKSKLCSVDGDSVECPKSCANRTKTTAIKASLWFSSENGVHFTITAFSEALDSLLGIDSSALVGNGLMDEILQAMEGIVEKKVAFRVKIARKEYNGEPRIFKSGLPPMICFEG